MVGPLDEVATADVTGAFDVVGAVVTGVDAETREGLVDAPPGARIASPDPVEPHPATDAASRASFESLGARLDLERATRLRAQA